MNYDRQETIDKETGRRGYRETRRRGDRGPRDRETRT